MAIVGISLGSNLGDKLLFLQQAKKELIHLLPAQAQHRQAPIYKTTPIDCPENSPDFFNTAIEISYQGTPQQLLAATQNIESKIGRKPKIQLNEPRPIDIDILYFDDVILKTTQLTLPHPRAHLRRFVLEPLSTICPNRILPKQNLTILHLLENLSTTENCLKFLSHW